MLLNNKKFLPTLFVILRKANSPQINEQNKKQFLNQNKNGKSK
jgi:hypothetical protein